MSNEVSHDLRALAEMQLPPKSEPVGRNLVKLTILLFSITILTSLTTVTYALFASIDREAQLKTELSCVRKSAVVLDRRISEGVSVLIDSNGIVLGALNGVAVDDPELLHTYLSEVPNIVTAGEEAQANLDVAVAARELALKEC